MKRLLSLLLGCVAIGQTGCSSLEVQDYAQEKPALHLESYLNGTIDAYGIYRDRAGRVQKRFHVVIQASWKGDVGTLDEQFTYADGTHSQRVWTLRKQSDGKYIGTASDVVGEALGEVSGNALRWRYVLDVESEGKHYHVNFDDWMYLMDDKVMLNHSKMSKWGFYLGEVILSFQRR